MKRSMKLFGVEMHTWSMAETIDEIAARLNAGTFTQHVVVNVAKLVNMQKDLELLASVQECDIVNIDGAGVVFAGRLLGFDIPERVAGIDLFLQLLRLAEKRGEKVYFLGATDSVVTQAVAKIRKRFPGLKIAGWQHGYFGDRERHVVQQISDSEATMLFVALSSPKKENFIHRWKNDLHVNFVMGVGGSFDVVAGKVKRAPKWMQKAGLEWLYRLMQEPGRMWRRYLYTNAMFLWMLVKGMLSERFKTHGWIDNCHPPE